MIKTFKHRGLERFFKNDDHRGILARTEGKTERLLDRLDSAVRPEDMNLNSSVTPIPKPDKAKSNREAKGILAWPR